VSHAGFLRDHWDGEQGANERIVVELVRALVAAGEQAAAQPPADAVAHLGEVVGGLSGLEPGDAAVLTYAARLTLAPRTVRAAHLSPLREAGLSDDDVHDVANVIACFNYMNRLADGLGVVQGSANRAWAQQLLGESAWARHQAWGRPEGASRADGA